MSRRDTWRVLAAATLLALTAVGVARVFDRMITSWTAAAVVPVTVIAVIGVFSRTGRWFLHALAAVVTSMIAAVVAGGRAPADSWKGFWGGWSSAVSTDWPSPTRPELVAFAALVVAVAAAVTVELALSRRFRATTLLPAVLLGLGVLVLSAAAGPPSGLFLVAWVVAAAVVLALGPGGVLPELRRHELRGEARAVGSVVALAVFGGVLVTGAAVNDRFDPRSASANPLVESDALNPLSQVAAQQAIDPPEPVFTVDGDLADRWRTRVLDSYDGVSWSSTLTVRPVSSARLSVVADEAAKHQVVTFSTAGTVWVPVPGSPTSIDRAVASDTDRSTLRLDEKAPVGARLEIDFLPSPTRQDVPDTARSARQPDQEAAPFTALADSLAGDGSLVARLAHLEAAFGADYELTPTGPSGSNIGLLQYAMETTLRGTAEQFVSVFVLMARTMGARARIAIGYTVPADGRQVTTADAAAWPEVWFEGIGWIAYDPVPTRIADSGPPGQRPTGQRPSAIPAQPPVAPPAPNPDPVEDPTATIDGSTSGLVRAMLLVGGAGGTLLLAVAGACGLVLSLKRRRRRLRIKALLPHHRVLGAWAEATDALVDRGARFHPFQTNGEMVVEGAALLSMKGRAPLADLAGLANTAAHAEQLPDDLVAAHAVRLLGQVEQVADDGLSRRRRWRATLSTRSLRRSTRSPVR